MKNDKKKTQLRKEAEKFAQKMEGLMRKATGVKEVSLKDIVPERLWTPEARAKAFEKLAEDETKNFFARISKLLVDLELMPKIYSIESTNNLGHKLKIEITGEKK